MPTPRKTKSKKTKTSTGTSKKAKTTGRTTKSRAAAASAKPKPAKKTKTSSKAKSPKKTKTKVVTRTTKTKTSTKTKTAARTKTKNKTKTAPRQSAASKPSAAATSRARSKSKKAAVVKSEPTAAEMDRSHLDDEFLSAMRAALVAQRGRLLNVVKSTRAQMAEKNNALPDVSDQAAEGYGDELAVGLIAIEAAQLEDIEAAIERIDKGSYGICEDTGRPIPKKRLEVLPFVRRCLEAEQAREHRARTQGGYVDEDDDD